MMDDREFEARCAEALTWDNEPTTRDGLLFVVELTAEYIERLRDRLLPEHSLSLDPAERADLEQLLAGLVEDHDHYWLKAIEKE
jgi:hypothetical protein